MSGPQGTALITGASAGIGSVYADRLAKRGYDLILRGTCVTVQGVLPGATATPFWAKAGRPVEDLPGEIVMTAEDMVDASVAGLDQHELITIPALPDTADWEKYEGRAKLWGQTFHVRSPRLVTES